MLSAYDSCGLLKYTSVLDARYLTGFSTTAIVDVNICSLKKSVDNILKSACLPSALFCITMIFLKEADLFLAEKKEVYQKC